jgi:elongator complex protein 6
MVGESSLSSPDFAAVSGETELNIQRLKDDDGGGEVVLVIDQLDLILATGGDQFEAVKLAETLMGLRQVRETLTLGRRQRG